jgi:hypothetical protein
MPEIATATNLCDSGATEEMSHLPGKGRAPKRNWNGFGEEVGSIG